MRIMQQPKFSRTASEDSGEMTLADLRERLAAEAEKAPAEPQAAAGTGSSGYDGGLDDAAFLDIDAALLDVEEPMPEPAPLSEVELAMDEPGEGEFRLAPIFS
jgi:hypothetical protein